MNRKAGLVLVAVTAIMAISAIAGYATLGHRTSPQRATLPSYCTRPGNGFLIVASSLGYNDSVDRLNFTSTGGVTAPWPVVSVRQGSNVTIAVCNTDSQAHGFEVQHYYESGIYTVAPGQSITVSFVASQAGTFRIYCSIPCTIHWAMQYGQLRVL